MIQKTRFVIKTWFAFALVLAVVALCLGDEAVANDKVKQALKKYEQRMEEERAKVVAVFEKESKLASRQTDPRHLNWILDVKRAWMDRELMITERGNLRYFNGAEESFDASDFGLSGGFTRIDKNLMAENGNATIRLGKPAAAVYFRGLVQCKHNFVVQLNEANLDPSQDLSIVVGGWNNTRSEIHLDNRTVAAKAVGMPRRWLCEVGYENQVVTVYANGVELMKAKINRPLNVNLINVSVSYDSETTMFSPVVRVK